MPVNYLVDIVTLIISGLAIIISLISFIIQIYSDKKINKANLEAVYYEKTFTDFLLVKIPNARKYIHFNGNELSGTELLVKVLVNMLKSSIFFKYKDSDFYLNLEYIIFEIEDYIIEKEGEMNDNEYNEFVEAIDKKLEDLYKLINNKYIGN